MKKSLLAASLALTVNAASAQTTDRVLVIVTAATKMTLQNGKDYPTGYFLGELSEPLEALVEAGIEFDIATPGGVVPTMDENGNRLFYWSYNVNALRRGLEFAEKSAKMRTPLVLESIREQDLANYAGVFVPGGHGPMVDLLDNASVAMILRYFHEQQKPTALLCHAPAVLLSLNTSQQPWPYIGYNMTVVSDLEEKVAERFFLKGKVPFAYPEMALKNAGAIVHTHSIVMRSNVVQDRELITGQNPYAAREFGEVFVKAIQSMK